MPVQHLLIVPALNYTNLPPVWCYAKCGTRWFGDVGFRVQQELL